MVGLSGFRASRRDCSQSAQAARNAGVSKGACGVLLETVEAPTEVISEDEEGRDNRETFRFCLCGVSRDKRLFLAHRRRARSSRKSLALKKIPLRRLCRMTPFSTRASSDFFCTLRALATSEIFSPTRLPDTHLVREYFVGLRNIRHKMDIQIPRSVYEQVISAGSFNQSPG